MDPIPFYFSKSRIKAIVLGADPTNQSDHGTMVELHYAFGIGQDPRYFQSILDNLNLLELHLEDLYIDNLLSDYQEKETGKNKQFIEKAREHCTEFITKLNKMVPDKKVPVFITSHDIYKALLKDGEKVWQAKDLYELKTEIPVPADSNRLGKPLIPLFRHIEYMLKDWTNYRNHIITFLNL
jgi:hypothetical protein